MPVMIMAAEAFGKTGRETPEELDADKAMLKKIEAVRLKRGSAWGWGRIASGRAEPVLVSRPVQGGNIASRYFTPHACPSLACGDRRTCRRRRRGSSRNRREPLYRAEGFSGGVLSIEHPSGHIEVDLVSDRSGAAPVSSAPSFVRTARRIFEGLSTFRRRFSTDALHSEV